MTKIAFVGGLRGFTPIQRSKVEKVLVAIKSKYGEITLLHGDARGADEVVHVICQGLNIPVEIYPRLDDKRVPRANCQGAVKIHEGRPGLKKFNAMIENSSILLATPPSMDETEESSIWFTINNAMRKRHKVYMISPLGNVWVGMGD